MFLKRAFNTILLTAFAVFAAGGPGLHYAPFLGHHHSSGHHASGHHSAGHHLCSDHQAAGETRDQSQHESCGCGELHETSDQADAQTQLVENIQLAENSGHSHSCDHQCLICQFFSSITFESVTEFTITGDQRAYQLSAGPTESVDSQLTPAFYQRGPPVACPIV